MLSDLHQRGPFIPLYLPLLVVLLKPKMLFRALMHSRAIVRFVICMSFVGFAVGAICVPEKCGHWEVSYPFYINNSECGWSGFNIHCTRDEDSGKKTLFLPLEVSNNTHSSLETAYYKIWEIDYSGYIVIDSSSLKASSCGHNKEANAFKRFDLPGPFYFSMSNKFVVVGCNATGSYTYGDRRGEARCVSSCNNQTNPPYCRYGCCEISVPDNNWSIKFRGEGANDGNCGFSTIMDPSTFPAVNNKTVFSWEDVKNAHYGLRLNWGIGSVNCSKAKNTTYYPCSINAECLVSPKTSGLVCKCPPGYQGTGYLSGTNCKDINECHNRSLNACVGAEKGGMCNNSPGSYNCSCAKGYLGDGFQNGTRCTSRSSNDLKSAIIGSLSTVGGVSVVACGLFWWLSCLRLKQARDKHFRENGGIELKGRIDSTKGEKRLKLFSEREILTASNNYSIELGKGGFATVYKGVLEDGTHIAIKKSQKASSKEFINEIASLSYCSHRNIVKLLGCCLETAYPLVVYEFVSNGTVYDHIQSKEKQLKWETRLQIAMETAEAMAYMHRQDSQGIFHRDIKSSNILLDDTFTPKVADFGISRFRPSDDDHLSTAHSCGTPGYLDPEFMSTNQFTDKSDVFSFGVVLLELLTGLKPLLSIAESKCTLYHYFLSKFNENGHTGIFDRRVLNEESQGQMENMASLAKVCLQKEAKSRPSMREVVDELVWVRAAIKQPRLVAHTSDLNQAKNYHTPKITGDNIQEHYFTSTTSTTMGSDGPTSSSTQIEISDEHAR